MRARHAIHDDRGFTIVEVLVAAVILLVGMLGVATMVNQSNATTTSNKAREQGLALARDLLESARSVKYQALRPGSIVSTLQAMSGFGNAGAGAGWTIKRRGIVYSVSAGVCSVDDPGDATGPHVANAFCARPAVQATGATCKTLIGTPARINGTGAAGLDAADCGLDTNLDGEVDGLLQTSATACPAGTSIANNTCDSQPDDFKRLVVLVTWDRGSGSRYVLEQATISFPGLSAYGKIQSLTVPNNATPVAGGYVVNGDGSNGPTSLTFNATSSQNASQVDWFLNGQDQGPATWSGSSGSFTWNLGPVSPAGTVSPPSTEIFDGPYDISARVQDPGGIHGIALDTTVTLNRRAPFPPTNFNIVGTPSTGMPTSVTATWAAPPDRDVVGYRMKYATAGGVSQHTVSGCDPIPVTPPLTCTDSNPPSSSSVTYWVVALDRDANGQLREGDASNTRSIQTYNTPPTVPQNVTGSASSGKVTLTWDASTDAENGIQTYQIYRSTSSGTAPAYYLDAAVTSATGKQVFTETVKTGKSYWYQVRAVDQNGATSGLSTPIVQVNA